MENEAVTPKLTNKEYTDMGKALFDQGLNVTISVGPPQIVAIVAVSAVTSTVTFLALSTLNVLAKRALKKMQAEGDTNAK